MPDWFTPEIRDLLLDGTLMTVVLTAITGLLAFLLGVGVSWLRILPGGRWMAIVYVECFRNLPALVLIILLAYGLPNLFDMDTRRNVFFQNDLMLWLRDWTGILIPYYALAAGIAITLNTSAYIVELLRAGMNTLDRNHLEAARSLGANPHRVFFFLLLPHGIQTASPAIITRLVHHLKNTALASLVAVPELFKAAQTAISRTFFAVELLVAVAVIYWLLTLSWAGLLRRLFPDLRRVRG